MAVHDDIVLSLEKKIEQVFQVVKSLKANNLRLKGELKNMSEAIRVRDQEIKDLKSKYHHLELAKGLAGRPGEAREAKLQINRMVREIDKCIALLNR